MKEYNFFKKHFLNASIALAISLAFTVNALADTFIFDFDDTINSGKTKSYYNILVQDKFAKTGKTYSDAEAHKYFDGITKDIAKTKNLPVFEACRRAFKVAGLYPDSSEIWKIRYYMEQSSSRKIKKLIKHIVDSGNDVFVVGSCTYGCSFVPMVLSNYGVRQEHVFSGYFEGSEPEQILLASDTQGYRNCANQEKYKDMPIFNEKGALIKYLKEQGVIKGRTIHIGDGQNDLEVWKSGAVDLYIGVGYFKEDPIVKANAPIYASTIKDLKSIVEAIIDSAKPKA